MLTIDVEKIFEKTVNSEILLYIVNNMSSATQIFELLNDRGKSLSDLESLKSFLMYKINITTNSSDQSQDEIQSTFGNIYRLIETYSLNEKDVLRYHTIAFEESNVDYYEQPKQYIKNIVNKLINDNKSEEAAKFIMGYNERLLESFELFVRIKNNVMNINKLEELFMIGRVGPFYPIMMKTLKENPEKFEELIEKLVQFTFRATLVGLRSNGETNLYHAIRNNKDIIEILDRIVKENWWNINIRAKDALNYSNHYEWLSNNIVKFILFRYENNLRKTRFPLLTLREYSSQDSQTKLSIEHITAQKAENINMTEDLKENYLHLIGNLVLDCAASNSSKGCKKTSKKLEPYSIAPIMSQNEISQAKVLWDEIKEVKKYITLRNKRIIKFIADEFQIQLQ